MTDLVAGDRFGAWGFVRMVDATRKRALVACVCGCCKAVAVESLLDGASRGCGCRNTPRHAGARHAPSSIFARDVAKLESNATSRRHRPRWGEV